MKDRFKNTDRKLLVFMSRENNSKKINRNNNNFINKEVDCIFKESMIIPDSTNNQVLPERMTILYNG